MKLEYKNKENQYKTVKEVLQKHFQISSRLLTKLKNNQKIFINHIPAMPYQSITSEDTITIDISFEEQSENIVPTKMDLSLVFEDESMLILNKPPYLPIHPSISHYTDSLSNGVQYYFMKKQIQTKIRPVNRLDKDTSGLVIFAKNAYVQEALKLQMQKSIFKKSYQAILTRKSYHRIWYHRCPNCSQGREYY